MNDKRTPEARAYKRWRRERRIRKQVYRACDQVLKGETSAQVALEHFSEDVAVDLDGLQQHLKRRFFWATLLSGPRSFARTIYQWLRFSI